MFGLNTFCFTFSLLSTLWQQNNFYSRSLKLETISTAACEKEGNISWASVSESWGNNSKSSHFSPACPNCFTGILADKGEWNNLRNPSLKSSNTNRRLLPVKCLDLKNWGSSKRSLGIELKYLLNHFTESFKTKSNKRFQVEFVFAHFILLWNLRNLVELWGCFFIYFFHVYCLTYSANFLPIGKPREQESIATGALDSHEVIEQEISSLHVMIAGHYKIQLYTF